MGSLTDVGERAFLDLMFRNALASATTPMGLDATNMWLALFTVTPTDSTTGTEVTGGSYARVAVNRTGTGFAAATSSPSTTVPLAVVTFVKATADWGIINGFGWCKSLAGSLATDLFVWGAVGQAKPVYTDDIPSFDPATLLVTCD